MEHLFFNARENFQEVARLVSQALDAPLAEGDSANALGGIYHAASILGTLLRLERNSFEHETEYDYILMFRGDATSPARASPSTLKHLARAVAQLLADNAGVTVAREGATGLEFVRPEQLDRPAQP